LNADATGLASSAPELNVLRFGSRERIVVVAPHPDDEVLTCGGLIQQAIALGDSVWVIYVTSGDGSWPSAWRVTGNIFPGPDDYLRLGRVRIEEAKAGAQVLGLGSTRLTFLGYPDGGLTRLRQRNWRTPYRSAHTRSTAGPYGRTGPEYTGRQLLSDIESLLRALRPARVFAPHPGDAHPDHRSTAVFVARAGEALRSAADGPLPEVYSYLTHRPPYPEGNTDMDGRLSPPVDMQGPSHHWFTLDLDDHQRRTKLSALRCHRSQQGALGFDLSGYVNINEVFDRWDAASINSGASRPGPVQQARRVRSTRPG